MTNRKCGGDFEIALCRILAQNGFWAHNLAQNRAGQPADVLAVRNGRAYLIDCKVCDSGRFPFSRIESNQHTAMRLWKECGNGPGLFALRLGDRCVYMMDHGRMTALSQDMASIGEETVVRCGIPLERWMRECR